MVSKAHIGRFGRILVGSALVSTSALAQDSQAVTLLASADRVCSISAPVIGTGPVENFVVPTGQVFVVQQLAETTTLTTRAASLTLNLDAMCNGLHQITVSSDGSGLWLVGEGSDAEGFGTAVPFNLVLDWADEVLPILADGNSQQARQWPLIVERPNAGSLELRFEIMAGATNAGQGAPLVAGVYSDVITLKLEAQ